jgi:hypothetical protein
MYASHMYICIFLYTCTFVCVCIINILADGPKAIHAHILLIFFFLYVQMHTLARNEHFVEFFWKSKSSVLLCLQSHVCMYVRTYVHTYSVYVCTRYTYTPS